MSAERLAIAVDQQVRRLSRALSGARRGDVTGVHQARVASRRLRELLPVVADVGDADAARKVRATVRALTQGLGGVRELDVTLGLLDAAAARHAWRPSVVSRVRRTVDVEREVRRVALMAALRRPAARDVVRDLRRVLKSVDPTRAADAWTEMFDRRRRKRARALRGHLRALGTLYVPDRLHAVRIAAKKLRYSLEADRAIRRAAVTRSIHALEEMQEHLGQLHDLQMLQDRMHRVARDAGANRLLLAQLRRMSGEIEGECRTLHALVVTRAPRWDRLASQLMER